MSTMPLQTQIIRGAEPLQLRWGNFHIAAMALAACFDAQHGKVNSPERLYEGFPPGAFDCYPDAACPITRHLANLLTDYGALASTPLNTGSYTLTRKHKFLDGSDGEVLTLLPGDVLRAWRS